VAKGCSTLAEFGSGLEFLNFYPVSITFVGSWANEIKHIEIPHSHGLLRWIIKA
jgi:hypothetical protein